MAFFWGRKEGRNELIKWAFNAPTWKLFFSWYGVYGSHHFHSNDITFFFLDIYVYMLGSWHLFERVAIVDFWIYICASLDLLWQSHIVSRDFVFFFFLPFTHVHKFVYKRDNEHLMLSIIIFFISSLCRVLGSWHTLQVDGYLLPICIHAWPLEHIGHLLFIPRHHDSSTLVPRGFVFFFQTHPCKRWFARGFKGHLMLKSLHLRVTHK